MYISNFSIRFPKPFKLKRHRIYATMRHNSAGKQYNIGSSNLILQNCSLFDEINNND